MKYFLSFAILLSVFIISCSDNDEPKTNENALIGYWAITHITTIEHDGQLHSTSDVDVPPHGSDSYISEDNSRIDILIFDEDYVTVRGDMPNRPKAIDFDMETTDGQSAYLDELENWEKTIGSSTDQYGWPVGEYLIKGDKLIFGSLCMGTINFSSQIKFTLDYTKTFDNNHYRRHIYTYSRIYSLTL